MNDDKIEDFMNSGNNTPGFTFTNVGDSIMGTVVRRDLLEVKVIGSKTGETEPKLILELKTDNEYTQVKTDRKTGQPITVTGDEWTLWIGRSQMLTALKDAMKEADAPKGAPLVGDRIKITFAETEPSKTQGFNPKKVYKAIYKAGDPAPVVDASDLL